MDDLYGTLGVADKKFEASEKDIGLAYKRPPFISIPTNWETNSQKRIRRCG